MQAVVITAYKSFEQLQELAELLSEKFLVYIHIDRRVPKDKYEALKSGGIRVYSLYPVNWGGSNHLKAILYLMHEALKEHPDLDYIHIISGQDWPTRPVEEIYNFFDGNLDIYMCSESLEDKSVNNLERIRNWQKYYSFLDIFDYKQMKQKLFVKGLVQFQKLMGVDRLKKIDIKLCHGLVWGGMPGKAARACFDFIKENPDFMTFMEYGHASEEFFFQTIFENSKDWKPHLMNQNLRFMLWERKHGSYPGILDEDDLEKIKEGNYMFMRKVEFPISRGLVDRLNIV